MKAGVEKMASNKQALELFSIVAASPAVQGKDWELLENGFGK